MFDSPETNTHNEIQIDFHAMPLIFLLGGGEGEQHGILTCYDLGTELTSQSHCGRQGNLMSISCNSIPGLEDVASLSSLKSLLMGF